MRILVYGAGPIGSYLAGKLSESKLDVTLLARGGRLRSLSRYRVVLKTYEGVETTRVRVPLLERLGPEEAYDLVMVALGKNFYSGALPFLAANISTPNVLFVGNNVEGPGEMVRLLGRERVLLGFPEFKAELDGREVEYAIGEKPSLRLGDLNGGESERLSWLKGVLEGAGFEVNVSPNMEAWLKCHASLVLPLSGAFIRAGRDLDKLSKDRDALVLILKAMREGLGVIKTLNIPVLPSNLRRIEQVPNMLTGTYARRLLKRRDLEYVLESGEKVQEEMRVLADEFQELKASTSLETPALDEVTEQIRSG